MNKPGNDLWAGLGEEWHAENTRSSEVLKIDVMTPREISLMLDESVIGQSVAKQALAIAVHGRLLSINNCLHGNVGEEYYFEKNNVLMIGDTGCGKTHLVRTLGEIVSLPLVIEDATTLTSAGYVGNNVDDCLFKLAKETNAFVDNMFKDFILTASEHAFLNKIYFEHAIIYIDEIDKVATNKRDNGKDISGKAVQEGFLKMIEGQNITMTSGALKGVMSTKNMLFVFGGAFNGLNTIVSARTNVKQIGFTKPAASEESATPNIKDLTDFGMIPEFLGRISSIVNLEKLSTETIARIFVEPKRSLLSQIINEFASSGIKLEFTEEAVKYIIEQAVQLKLGARGLRTASNEILRQLRYLLPSLSLAEDPLVVTKELLVNLRSSK